MLCKYDRLVFSILFFQEWKASNIKTAAEFNITGAKTGFLVATTL